MKKIIDNLYSTHNISKEDLTYLLQNHEDTSYLLEKSREVTDKVYGRNIYVRGLIEFSNYCKKNCMYCGIRAGNDKAKRYRLLLEDILLACEVGYINGFRTFVLQGGEDPYYDDEKMIKVVKQIRSRYPECAITLSIGERSREIYKALLDAGANRFLLRHETIHEKMYSNLHPKMSYTNRLDCLYTLKDLGYQTGTGFLIGLPNQVITDYVDDLLFIKKLAPEMVGIGPFIAHKDTPLGKEKNGSVKTTQIMLAIIRLLLPEVLLPSTSAFNTLSDDGFISGFDAGANVFMPNLTPDTARLKYNLYEGKVHIDAGAKSSLENLSEKLNKYNYNLDMSRGDHILMQKEALK